MLTRFSRRILHEWQRARRIIMSRPKFGVEEESVFKKLNDSSICIDCGANVGEVVAKMNSYGATVYAFEPHPAAIKVLETKFSDNPKVKIIPHAVSDKEGEDLNLYFHKDALVDEANSGSFSTSASLVSDKTNINRSNYVKVKCLRLSQFILSLDKDISILKIDIEGAEDRVIRDLLRTGAYKKAEKIYVETHELKVPWLFLKLLILRMQMKLMGVKNFDLGWN